MFRLQRYKVSAVFPSHFSPFPPFFQAIPSRFCRFSKPFQPISAAFPSHFSPFPPFFQAISARFRRFSKPFCTISVLSPFYILIDQLWKAINDCNGSVPVQEGAYTFDIPFYNEEVIREIINNAFAHRDYRLQSEIVIKQYPAKLTVASPGGFPLGVTLDNILTVSSTPRNRLLADVLAQTGIVERSGQGMDVIFRLTLSEGKQMPDYNKTDDYQVVAILSARVKDPGFALFINSILQELPENQKLSVFDILTFCDIKDGLQPKDKRLLKIKSALLA